MVELPKLVPSSPLYELLDSLVHPMEDASEKQLADNRREAPSFSALAYFDNPEPKQTEIIASLLQPKGKHGQGTLFLRNLLTSVWPSPMPHAWQQNDLEHAKVRPNHFIPGDYGKGTRQRFVDLFIQVGKDRCLVIESKAKGAEDQPGQLDAYLCYLKRCFPASRNCKLLYLSLNGEPPDKTSISPEDWNKACADGIADTKPYAVFIREWLDACRKDCKAERVKFFIDDLIAFTDPNAKRLAEMTPPLYTEIRDVLFDSKQEKQRETLLSICELSAQIYDEILKFFQDSLLKRLQEQSIRVNSSSGLTGESKWGEVIKGQQRELPVKLSADCKPLVAYAAVQRCPPCESHKSAKRHLIIGIQIEGMEGEGHQKGLKPWRELAKRSGLPAGTDDKNWVWQQIPEGFDDLDSKNNAIRLLDPTSATDIVDQMQDRLMQFVDAVAQDRIDGG